MYTYIKYIGIYDVIRPKVWHLSDLQLKIAEPPFCGRKIAKKSKPNTRHTLLPAVYTTVGPKRKQSNLGLQAVVCLSLSVCASTVGCSPLLWGSLSPFDLKNHPKDPGCSLLTADSCNSRPSIPQIPAVPADPCSLLGIRATFSFLEPGYPADPCCPLRLGTLLCSRISLLPPWDPSPVLHSASQNPALYPAVRVATIYSLLYVRVLSSGALFTDVSTSMRPQSELAAIS